MNWTSRWVSQVATTSNFAIRASNGNRIVAFDGIEFYTRARSSALSVTLSIWSAKGPMGGGTRLATGTMAVGTTLNVYKATFATPAVVPANSSFWIVFNQGWNIYMPLGWPGTKTTHYWYSGNSWKGPYSAPWRYRLYCKPKREMAEATLFGQGCQGSLPGCVAEKGSNWKQQLAGTTTTAKKVGILELSLGGSAPVCGVSIRSRARTKAATLSVSAHQVTWKGSSPVPGKLLATTTMKVGTVAGDYKAQFRKAFAPPASGMVMFVMAPADQIILPVSRKGASGFHAWFNGKAWSSLKYDLNWIWRLERSLAARAPEVAIAGRPLLGKSFSTVLSKARPSTGALFFLGSSNTRLGALPLPMDLKALGAPGCFLLASNDITLAVLTDSVGNAAVRLPVPNMSSLVGTHFYNQFLVYDPGANRLNLVASNASDAKVGRY